MVGPFGRLARVIPGHTVPLRATSGHFGPLRATPTLSCNIQYKHETRSITSTKFAKSSPGIVQKLALKHDLLIFAKSSRQTK